jgi:hypothetical protein
MSLRFGDFAPVIEIKSEVMHVVMYLVMWCMFSCMLLFDEVISEAFNLESERVISGNAGEK